MIDATIGHQKFILESQKDAEQLLSILNRASQVERDYDFTDHQEYYHPASTGNTSIEITSAEIVTSEEHLRREQAHAAKTAKLAAVGATA